jgi:hypothetical protein
LDDLKAKFSARNGSHRENRVEKEVESYQVGEEFNPWG